MVKKKNKIPIAVVVIALVVGVLALSLTGYLEMDWEEQTNASLYGASVTAYYQGEPVSESIIMGGFTRGDTAIDEIVVRVHWSVTGESVDLDTFRIVGTITASHGVEGAGWIEDVSYGFSTTGIDGVYTKALVLGTDICHGSDIVDGGWDIKFEIELVATIKDTLGRTLTDNVSFSGRALIEYDSNFILNGYVEY